MCSSTYVGHMSPVPNYPTPYHLFPDPHLPRPCIMTASEPWVAADTHPNVESRSVTSAVLNADIGAVGDTVAWSKSSP